MAQTVADFILRRLHDWGARRVYGYPGGEMLLHASRLVVPRGAKPTIDVTAPLPDRFGEWTDAARDS